MCVCVCAGRGGKREACIPYHSCGMQCIKAAERRKHRGWLGDGLAGASGKGRFDTLEMEAVVSARKEEKQWGERVGGTGRNSFVSEQRHRPTIQISTPSAQFYGQLESSRRWGTWVPTLDAEGSTTTLACHQKSHALLSGVWNKK